MLRAAMDTVTPATLSTSAMSVVMRDSTSPVRVCRKKAGSSVSTWAYRSRRRSAVTRSPSRVTKKKRRPVAAARPRATTTANSNAPSEKPRSITTREAPVRPRVAEVETVRNTREARPERQCRRM